MVFLKAIRKNYTDFVSINDKHWDKLGELIKEEYRNPSDDIKKVLEWYLNMVYGITRKCGPQGLRSPAVCPTS